MNSYTEAIDYLYSCLPMFTRDGASAYKENLDRTVALCEAIGHPQDKFKTIHVAGTNGKGSSSHMLAAVFASAGYKTGLYTSPHLVDFRERIRINGEWIDSQFIVDFINAQQQLIEEIQPSFFEVTVALAFDYFAQQKVDIAIIEVGLGGRLDSTNIIQPEVSLITNIGMDHMYILGHTLEEIAVEKAGIIKKNTPVIISETQSQTAPVFQAKAAHEHADITFADQYYQIQSIEHKGPTQQISVRNKAETKAYSLDLTGTYQAKNILGVLATIDILREKGYTISENAIQQGLAHVQQLTGFQGRWQTLSTDPFIICDTGHNEDGIKEVVKNLETVSYTQLHVVLGAMKDKDLDHILPYLPKDAMYYFCSPALPRAMEAEELEMKASNYGLDGYIGGAVTDALDKAIANYKSGDLIFVGGSNFVVAEVLANRSSH
jgi:dihydrofolate synthase/folylpolyglutamate synthase